MNMIVPVRCFSCGKVIGQEYEAFIERVEKGEEPDKVFNDLGIERYCCRRTLFSHVDLIEEVMKYNT